MFISFLLGFLVLNRCEAFHSGRTIFQNKRQIIRNTIEIDSEHPSLIAKTLSQEFYKYGIPQSYDDFIRQLANHQVESVSLISKNNEINGFVSIDTLHKPHMYDMVNSHIVQILPTMGDSLLQKLDKFK